MQIRVLKIHYLLLDVSSSDNKVNINNFCRAQELSYDDFDKGDQQYFNQKKMNVYLLRFQDVTYKAYGIIIDGVLVYSGWISTAKLGMSGNYKPITLQSNEGYLEDDYCHPDFRKMGFHTQMIAFRVDELKKRGKSKIIATVENGNIPALRALYKNGFMMVGSFYIGKIFGVRFNTLNKKKFEV